MELIDFIIAAKLDGYATGGEGKEISFEDGYKGFEYTSRDFSYLDRYTGLNPFTGTETVSRNSDNQLVWIMNYFGKSNSPSNQLGPLYTFLKAAMQHINRSYPFRGPERFESENWEYRNIQSGDLNLFFGREEINLEGKKVYELFYHGGVLAG